MTAAVDTGRAIENVNETVHSVIVVESVRTVSIEKAVKNVRAVENVRAAVRSLALLPLQVSSPLGAVPWGVKYYDIASNASVV